MNAISFEEKFRIHFTRVQLLSATLLTCLFIGFLTYLALVFTPLSYLLPEDQLNKNKSLLVKTYNEIERLDQVVEAQNKYISNLQAVVLGKIEFEDIYRDTSFKSEEFLLDTVTTDIEKVIAAEIENRKTSIEPETKKSNLNLFLIEPVKGVVSQKFNLKTHPAVDIVTEKNATIKSVIEGVVIYSGYNDLEGWVIMVKHQNAITSVYKHCEKLLKQQGEFVKTGEAIAIAGESGENSTGPHLHFELWGSDGPLNPLNYLSFQ